MVMPTTATIVLVGINCFPLFFRRSTVGRRRPEGHVHDRCGGPREASSSFVLLYINFSMHPSHSTTFTNAPFDSPLWIYAKGSSTVLR